MQDDYAEGDFAIGSKVRVVTISAGFDLQGAIGTIIKAEYPSGRAVEFTTDTHGNPVHTQLWDWRRGDLELCDLLDMDPEYVQAVEKWRKAFNETSRERTAEAVG